MSPNEREQLVDTNSEIFRFFAFIIQYISLGLIYIVLENLVFFYSEEP